LRHLALLYYLLSLITGCVSIGLCLLIYRQYRKVLLRDYALFLSALALILTALVLDLYGELAELGPAGPAVRAAANLLDKLGSVLFLASAPFFFHRLLALEIGAAQRVAYIALAGAAGLLAVLAAALPPGTLPFALPVILMYGMILYCLALVGLNLHRVGDPILRKVLRLFFWISLGFFPLMLTEVLREHLPAPLAVYDLFELFALPSYFLVINLLSIILCFRTLSQPPLLAGGQLTAHFAARFGITPREREIVQLLLAGKSYNQVADALFISYKTVDNHVQNIYQKTGVRNRLQLANLLQAGAAGSPPQSPGATPARSSGRRGRADPRDCAGGQTPVP
jgi:DNA-binding CsgD family transcriptional regulator